MPAKNKQISLTSNDGAQNLSRKALLAWVNATIKRSYKKVEELGSGEAYCMMLELLYPNTVAIRNVTKGATQEYQYRCNLKLFQDGLTKIHCEYQVPIEQLVKLKFMDNLKFVQWFKKFYDAQLAKKNMYALGGAGALDELQPPGDSLTSEANKLVAALSVRLTMLEDQRKELDNEIECVKAERDALTNKST